MRDIDDDDREERFVRVYRDFQPKIAAYIRRRLPESDAADALAETFLTAWRMLESVPEEPLPWLYRIAANSVANQRRSVRRWLRLQHRAHAWRELDSVHDFGACSGDLRGTADSMAAADRTRPGSAAPRGLGSARRPAVGRGARLLSRRCASPRAPRPSTVSAAVRRSGRACAQEHNVVPSTDECSFDPG
jgi:sigma-70-like protein